MMDEFEPLIDLKKGLHRGKGEGFQISVAERVRAARRLPQAVVKVTSFSRGLRQVCANFRYITRQGRLPLETDAGEILADPEEQMELARNWSIDFGGRKDSRDTANIVFSMPRGSPLRGLKEAVRQTAKRAFPDHDWVFAVHEDRDHPHAHLAVKMRGRESERKLRLRKGDLQRLRSLFAEAARAQDVQLAASPRAVRGVGRKPERQALYHMRRRGTSPRVDVQPEIANPTAIEKQTPWSQAMAARHEKEQQTYETLSRELRSRADQKGGSERLRLLRAADDLARFGKSLPMPRTRRDEKRERPSGFERER